MKALVATPILAINQRLSASLGQAVRLAGVVGIPYVRRPPYNPRGLGSRAPWAHG